MAIIICSRQCAAGGAAQPAQDALRSAEELELVGRVGDIINGFVIHPSVGVKTFQEMVEYAKKIPGTLTFASSGSGTSTHLRLEMLKLKAGIDILHAPYRGGGDSLNDVLPGNAHMMNEPVSLPMPDRQVDPTQHQRQRASPKLPRGANLD